VPVSQVPAGRAFVRLPSGLALVLSASQPDVLPAGVSGEVIVEGDGQVPVTLALDGRLPVEMHPVHPGAADPAEAHAVLTGSVSPAVAGTRVQLLVPGRTLYLGIEAATDGSFSLDVPTAGIGRAVLVAAVGPGVSPALALVRTVVAADTSNALPALTLIEPQPSAYALLSRFGLLGGTDEVLPPDPFPAPPAGLVHAGIELRVAEGGPDAPWAASILATEGSSLPTYELPGFDLRHAHQYVSADRRAWSEVVGLPNALPTPLAPVAAIHGDGLRPGGRLTWEEVPGASLYTVRVTDRYTPTPPLWEAAVSLPSAAVPPTLALAGHELEVRVDAWDGAELDVYGLAGLPPRGPRAMRVPANLPGASGRHSWRSEFVTVP